MSLSNNNSPHQMKKSKFLLIRILWITLGSTFVAIGTIGIFVPGLPTTVFMILAAACYVRSSEKLYNWLIRNKTFGKYIKDYREGKGMPMMRNRNYGDLYIRAITEVPVSLTKEQKSLLEKFKQLEDSKTNPTIKNFFEKAKRFWKN